jgi:FlaA1/EpsC-like NDP-sugar epimerase
MITLKYCDYYELIAKSQDKDIIVFGAGDTLDCFLSTHKRDGRIMMLDRIVAILDNDSQKTGREIHVTKKAIAVETIEGYLRKGNGFQNCVIIMTMIKCHVLQVTKQLDALPELDGVTCYYGPITFMEKLKLIDYAQNKYSQNGEDGIIAKIYDILPPPPRKSCML